MAEKSIIQLIDELVESSIYGPEADAAFVALKRAQSITQLVELNIESPEILLRSIHDKIRANANRRTSNIGTLIGAIPSVAVQQDFI